MGAVQFSGAIQLNLTFRGGQAFESSLMCASTNGFTKVMKTLLDMKVDANAATQVQRTADARREKMGALSGA